MRCKSSALNNLMIIMVCALAYASAAGQSNADLNNLAVASAVKAPVINSNASLEKTSDPTGYLTRTYTIGANDLLRIELKDVPGVPRMVRVQADGSIAYPLAGVSIAVAGKTEAEVEAQLSESVKTLSKGGVRIKITEYLSHSVMVSGLVGDPGVQQIQRDAVPFFVIKAMTSPDPRATAVQVVRRGTNKAETHMLSEAQLDSLLIYPGDSVEFGNSSTADSVN